MKWLDSKEKIMLLAGLSVSVIVILLGLTGQYLSYEFQRQLFEQSSSVLELKDQKQIAYAISLNGNLSYISNSTWYGMYLVGFIGIWFFGGGFAMINRGLSIRTLFSWRYWKSYYGGEVFYREPKKRINPFKKSD